MRELTLAAQAGAEKMRLEMGLQMKTKPKLTRIALLFADGVLREVE